MLEKTAAIESRLNEINRLLEENAADYHLVAELSRERAELLPAATASQEYRKVVEQIQQSESLLDSDDEGMRELAQADLDALRPQADDLERKLKNLLVPKDKRDDHNVIMEIRAGTGGDEAALFAADLFRLYSFFAEKRRWKVEILSQNEIGIGGFKEIIFMIKGKGAYSQLKYESGVHRVQRVPTTEAQGRIHTSTITVAVMAEVEEFDIDIPESDIKIDVYKSAGAGGQNVQKNSTAVRITHLPSGMVVACQDERSQLQNKLRGMSILRARLYEIEYERRRNADDESRRSQIGTGERSEKIRTYNYPQSRVTDHRINYSSFNLPSVMNGNLDEFIEQLSIQDEAGRLATSGLGDSED